VSIELDLRANTPRIARRPTLTRPLARLPRAPGNADVSATVFVKFVFEYDKDHGWRPGQKPQDKPKFHVEKLRYSIEGNNVPMPPTLIKHILRVAIPGLIQRRLLLLLPKELGEYVQTARRGFEFDADVGLVGPALAVLDADIGFEIQGPERSTKEASKQKAKYEAAKEARNMLALTLPQAQILSELFGGRYAMLSPPRAASISNLIAFKARYDAHPKLFDQLCTVINAAYHIFAKKVPQADVSDFSFKEFMETTVSRVRKKPAKARVVVQNIDISVNADAVVTAIHDFTQRAIEELVIKGPMSDPSATLESMRDTIAEDLEVLHAWHVFALRELDHFKSKFKTAGGTVLLAADKNGVVAGIENSHYEGPLRLRMPMSLPTDQDGAISFEIPLPSPAGSLGVFMDNFKGLTVPCHLRCVADHDDDDDDETASGVPQRQQLRSNPPTSSRSHAPHTPHAPSHPQTDRPSRPSTGSTSAPTRPSTRTWPSGSPTPSASSRTSSASLRPSSRRTGWSRTTTTPGRR